MRVKERVGGDEGDVGVGMRMRVTERVGMRVMLGWGWG